MSVEAGQRWRLTRDHGNPPHTLAAGSIGTVRELVDADTPGAHDDEEDAAVLEFEHRQAVFDENDQPAAVIGRRAVAFPLSDFEGEDALLAEVTD